MRISAAFVTFVPLGLLAALVIASCAAPINVPVTHFVCPKLVIYTAAQQAEAAKEMSILLKSDVNAELPKMMTDYGRERAAIRACQQEAAK